MLTTSTARCLPQIASLAALGVLCACTATTHEQDPPARKTVSDPVHRVTPVEAGEVVDAPDCVDGAVRCRHEGVMEICDGGQWQGEPCTTGESCRETTDGPAMCLPRCDGACAFTDRALLASREGYINVFAGSGPHTGRDAPEAGESATLRWLDRDARDARWRVMAHGDPIMQLARRRPLRRNRSPEVFVLTANVYSAYERDVTARIGLTGQMDLFVGRSHVWTAREDRYMLLDDHLVPLRLKRGQNRIVLRLERLPPRALRFSLRLRDHRGGNPPGLVWSLPSLADQHRDMLCDAFVLEPGQTLGSDGITVTAAVKTRGLRPAFTDGVDVSLRHEDGKKISRRLGWKALSTEEGGHVSLPLERQRPGVDDVEIAFNRRVCATRHVRSRGDLETEFLDLDARRKRAVARHQDWPDGTRDSLEFHASRIRELLEENDSDGRFVNRSLADYRELVEKADAGADPYIDTTGIVWRAYRSPMDGTLQPYTMWIPPPYARNPDKEYPLVLTFHGLGGSPDDMLLTTAGIIREEGQDREEFARKRPRIKKWSQVIAAPWGYGHVGQRQLGELDVLTVREKILAEYRIDRQRVSLTGASLGGTVAFVVPLHHPHLFAATSPLCGYPNVRTYRSVERVEKRPWEHWLIEQRAIANYAENGLHVPMKAFHGGGDDPDRSKVVTDRYRELGYRWILDIEEEAGHNIWDYAYETRILNWLSWRQTPVSPSRVRLRSAHLRYNRSHWLVVDRFTKLDDFAEIKGRRRDKKTKPPTITLDTTNTSAFTVLPSALPAEGPRQANLRVDGRDLGEIDLSTAVSLSRRDGQWAVVDEPDIPKNGKRHGLSGPLDDIWFSPFVVVYGTKDPTQTETNRMVAEHLRNCNYRSEIAMPVMADVDVKDVDLFGRGVVLIGNPRSNTITRRALASEGMPGKIAFGDDWLEVRGERFEGADVGISFVHPSPFDPDQYMVVHAGVGAEGTLGARYLPEYVPDFLVYDRRIRRRYWGTLLDNREVLAGGFFDELWQLPRDNAAWVQR